MQLYVFGDQTVENRLFLRQVCQRKGLLLTTFLECVGNALHEEISSLSNVRRGAHIPDFSNILELVERSSTARLHHPAVESALVCLAQLAHFIGHHEETSKNYPGLKSPSSPGVRLLGLCTGLLAASAVASVDSLIALLPVAVETVRVAFRTGAHVADVAQRLEVLSDTYESWSTVFAVTDIDSAEEALNNFHHEHGVSPSNRLCISVVASNSITITGPPSMHTRLLQSCDFFQRVHHLKVPVHGPYHTSHLHSRQDVEDILTPKTREIFGCLDVHLTVNSSMTGKPIAARSSLDLLRASLEEILLERPQWNLVVDQLMLEVSAPTDEKFLVNSIGPTNLTNSIMTALKSANVSHSHIEGQTDWLSQESPISLVATKKAASKIAIVGMAGRFPDAADHEILWTILEQGLDVHREIPKDRFDVKTHYDPTSKLKNTSHTPYGCFIKDPGLFDARFFNMSPREAAQTDPMQRLMLSTAYEAMEMAGIVPGRTPSTKADRIGTFYGQTSDDWREINAAQDIDTYFISGGVRAFGAGRINYHFKFSGPSFIIDTACSSSLAAIQLACTSLQAGECDTAFTGGANVLTNPDIFSGLSRGHFLSKTGSCKTFDNDADGYCRGDGVATVILKRLDDALTDKDPILGVILGTATNHSAEAISITHPHVGAQEFLFSKVLQDCGVDPHEIRYIEMHGTGTQAGDGVEMESVSNVFAPRSRQRGTDEPLYVGAIKANIGHGESVAGVSSLIKLLLMMQKNFIPPHCGIKGVMNRKFPVDLGKRNVNVARKKIAFPRPENGTRRVFLNNFSAAGGNTALLLEDAPKRRLPETSDPRIVSIVTVSAKSLASFKKNAQRLESYIGNTSNVDLSSLSYTTTSRRMHYNYRAAISTTDVAHVSAALRALRSAPPTPIAMTSPQVAFAFTGQGSQYRGIGMHLWHSSKHFHSDLELFNNLAQSQGFVPFLGLVDGSVEDIKQLSPVAVQLGLVCIQMALVRLWASWGIKPTCVVGHSLGEYAALNAAGVLSIADTIYLVGERARQMEEKCVPGTHAMLAVLGTVSSIQDAIRGKTFEVACINGATEIVVSGPVADIDCLALVLREQGFRCTRLNVPYAFHSSQVDCILESFEKSASAATYHTPKLPVISPLRCEVVSEGGVFGARYLQQQCRQAVNYIGGLNAASLSGAIDKKTLWLEIGPHPICSEMVKSFFDSSILTVPSLRRNEDPWKTIPESLCALYSAGVTVDWPAYHREYESSATVLNLPSYSFDDKVYWLDYTNDWCLNKGDTKPSTPAVEKPRPYTTSIHYILQESVEAADEAKVTAESDFSDPLLHQVVSGHLVNGAGLCPSSLYADMALTLAEYGYKLIQPDSTGVGMNVTSMAVPVPCIVKNILRPESQIIQIAAKVNTTHSQATIAISSPAKNGASATVHATCIVKYESESAWVSTWQRHAFLIQSRMEMLWKKMESGQAHRILRGMAYKLFSTTVQYSDKFRGMKEVILDSAHSEATSVVNFQAGPSDGRFYLSPYFIDSVAHLSGFVMNASDGADTQDSVYISHGWESMRFAKRLESDKEYHAHVKMQPCGKNIMAGDVHIFEEGIIVGEVGGLKFQRIPRKLLNTFLPPTTAVSPQERRETPRLQTAGKSVTVVKAPQHPKQQVKLPMKAMPKANTLASELTIKALNIIAAEIGVEPTELADTIPFADLGVDSLMILSISGRFREELYLDVPGSLFTDCPTIGDLKVFLTQQKGEATPELPEDDFTSSDSDSETVQSPASSLSSQGDDAGVLDELRSIIAEEMGMAIEEIADTTDLSTMGMDSLMSLTILGALREKTSLSVSPDLFVDNRSIGDIRKSLGLDSLPAQQSGPKVEEVILKEVSRQPSATSVLLQGNPRTATRKVFFFPDGSGSATSYVSIPPLQPKDLCVYGLNCPFMKDPASYTIGLPAVSKIYIQELLRRQPEGPYLLGGWSAGGVVALEVMRQLQAMDQASAGKNYRVERLLLLDAPCPVSLEPLPSRLHIFFNEIGLLGTGNPTETPAWLLPHFQASIDNLSAYQPEILPIDPNPAKVLLLWARDGVCKNPGDPRPPPQEDDPRSMKWLLDNRTDFGCNGWERLLGAENCTCVSIDGNHFTMMREPIVSEMAEMIRREMFG